MKLPAFTLGAWGYLIVGALSAATATSATYYVVHTANAVTITNLKLSSATKAQHETEQALEQLTLFIGRMNKSASNYQRDLQQIQEQYGSIENALAIIKKNKPLPLNCKPDVERLRVLKSATDHANSYSTPIALP